ncbi:hypothetical protein D9736_18435 [Escherichia sp. E10V10]|nr:hypothetical protein D9736_18435 [Escherichia sp. E10V10]
MRLFLNRSGSRLAPVLLSGLTSQRAGGFSFHEWIWAGILSQRRCGRILLTRTRYSKFTVIVLCQGK